MSSLRSRLILGSALIALVPLAGTLWLLTQRLESTVRAQAAERLEATLGGLRLQVAADTVRVGQQLRILARDPQLRRLYLVRPEADRDLADYLTERRTLLSLDALRVTDLTGRVVASGDPAGDRPAPEGARVEARAPILYQGASEGLVEGGLVLDAAFLARLARSAGIELILCDGAGRPLASTLAPPESAAASAAPAAFAAAGDAEVRRIRLGGTSYLARGITLPSGAAAGSGAPRIIGLVPTAPADRTVAAVQRASLILGALALLLAIGLGVLWSSQLSAPVERLAAFSRRVAQGEWDEPLTLRSVRELETLVAALEQMRGDLRAYRDRLVISERQAAWSQMARQVAHEVRNPLTPIAVSIADLKRSFEQRRPDFPEILDQAVRTVREEIDSLERMLREFAEFARMPSPQPAPCRPTELFADLASLYRREVTEGRLAFAPPPDDLTLTADAGLLRQALINLIKNGLEAIGGAGRVSVAAAREGENVTIAVSDDGPGLDAEQRSRLFTPGFTTKREGSGLGLTFVQRVAHEHGGRVSVDDRDGPGTTFRIHLPHPASGKG